MVVVKIKKEVPVQVEFKDWDDYNAVRLGGKTNMLDVRRVVELSHGLTTDKVKAIIENYEKLADYFQEDMGRKKKQLSEMD